jgi:predicted alternative tryptophan synthase beta-subunit
MPGSPDVRISCGTRILKKHATLPGHLGMGMTGAVQAGCAVPAR